MVRKGATKEFRPEDAGDGGTYLALTRIFTT